YAAGPRELLFERGNRVGEHALVRRRPGARKVGLRACQRQLEGPPFRFRLALAGRQRAPQSFHAFHFRLLELDVLALEAACQESVLSLQSVSRQSAATRD